MNKTTKMQYLTFIYIEQHLPIYRLGFNGTFSTNRPYRAMSIYRPII